MDSNNFTWSEGIKKLASEFWSDQTDKSWAYAMKAYKRIIKCGQ